MKHRRFFLRWFGLGIVGSFLGGVIAACARNSGDQAGSTAGFTEVGSVAQLDQAGFLLNEADAERPVMVIRNPSDPSQVNAFNAICPHKYCLITWVKADAVFACKCHESKFKSDGQVLNPPARDDLRSYPAKIVADRVLVKLA